MDFLFWRAAAHGETSTPLPQPKSASVRHTEAAPV